MALHLTVVNARELRNLIGLLLFGHTAEVSPLALIRKRHAARSEALAARRVGAVGERREVFDAVGRLRGHQAIPRVGALPRQVFANLWAAVLAVRQIRVETIITETADVLR